MDTVVPLRPLGKLLGVDYAPRCKCGCLRYLAYSFNFRSSMAFEMQQLFTSGRLQNSDLHSLTVSAAEVMSSFSTVTRDISPNTSRFSAYSSNSSTQKLKRRRARRGRPSKGKAAMVLLEDASACDPLTLNALASLSSNWLDLSFPDRTPTYTDYFVNYWRHALTKEQDIVMDHFTAVMEAIHEDLPAASIIRSTQSTPVQCNESSKCIRYENDLFAVTCPWDDDEQSHLDDWIEWDEWRREDDEVHIPTGDHHNYGAIGQPPIYPLRNMGTHFQIVAPKPVRAWNNITWLGQPPVIPEPVTRHYMEMFVDAAAVYATSQTPLMESTTIYSSTSTAYHAHAESTVIYNSASASPSSYLSVIAASIPPAGRCIPQHVNDPHLNIHGSKVIRPERQHSRDHKLFQFLRMSYDQKVAEVERLVRWMRSHSRRE
ncbi:uncharacterized protein BJ212DRAFT_1338160 [Suillus subaureus]|uniref:Uncharacterized protein n=1 Tax=Suillus subaureus TaxID=48587 RepID=A0A9P7JG86_9AGAM|nr:uncharacterized protein BJ212DRAFT_1338160 [Suillus subaureus]KAG1821184.1 hypothetical protein BJ212DRAFT_1338160 [Suillus subaureus]